MSFWNHDYPEGVTLGTRTAKSRINGKETHQNRIRGSLALPAPPLEETFFGEKMSEQLRFGEITRAEAEKRIGLAHQENPCIAAYGRDVFGRSCKTCSHLFMKQYSKRYFKCDLRKNTNGPGTDHRKGWPACGKYERNID